MTFDELFAVTPDGPDRWTAPGAPLTDERMVFGGLVVGQAIVAASQGTRRCHAFHAFFIGMGAKQQTFEISIERTRDGGSFATRNFQVHQGERLLLAGYSSHHDGDDGPAHGIGMPDVPPPDRIEELAAIRARQTAQLGKPPRNFLYEKMVDMRQVEIASRGGEPANAIWFRSRTPVRGDAKYHQAAIAFASDIGPIYVGLKNHREKGVELQTASLDHSMWFHREAAANEWLLQVMRSPIVGNGRGIGNGQIFNRSGELVASVTQEFLARESRPKRTR